MDIFKDQEQFMIAAGQLGVIENEEIEFLYEKLLSEEYEEWRDCCAQTNEEVKELCDILVVTSGLLISMLGREKAEQAWSLVHASNMAKVTGNIEKRSDGKVLKSDEWKKEIKQKLMEALERLL